MTFCFTTDLDWAPEETIEEILALFKDADIPLFPFITHKSKAIEMSYQGKHTGLHPNFVMDSTQGSSMKEVIDNVISLLPTASGFRCHNLASNWVIMQEFASRGLRWDSNQLFFLQPRLKPFRQFNGLICLPIFFEDDVRFGDPMTFRSIEKFVKTPGLKVFNFHPLHVALNTPNIIYYVNRKNGILPEPYRGEGVASLLKELLDYCKDKECAYLDEVINGRI